MSTSIIGIPYACSFCVNDGASLVFQKMPGGGVGRGIPGTGDSAGAVVMGQGAGEGLMEVKMAEVMQAKRSRGRPALDDSVKKRKKSISLYPRVGEFARAIGHGELSSGIEVACEEFIAMTPQQIEEAWAHRPEGLTEMEVKKTSISLTPEIYEVVMGLGDGLLSHGVRYVLHLAMATRCMKAEKV